MSISRAVAVFLVTLALAVSAPAQEPDPCPEATHFGPDYSGQDLRNENFANQDLTGANFTGALLQGANFDDAVLSRADFRGAALGYSPDFNRATSFMRADLAVACFAKLVLPEVRFHFADLGCTVFAGADVRGSEFGPVIEAAPPDGPCRTSFAGAFLNCEFIPQWKDLDLRAANVQSCFDRLAGADFSGGLMDGVVFSGLDLAETRWVGASLRRAYFVGSTLDDAVLSAADLRDAQLSGASAVRAKLDQQARLSGANLSGINLQAADLTGAVLQGADGLPAATLSLAFLGDAKLTDAQLTGVNLSHASFYGELANADNAVMTHVDFANANLGSADLTQGHLEGARLDGASLVNASLRGANLRPVEGVIGASLVQASLQGADMTEAELHGANLANAAVALDAGVPLFPVSAGLAADLDREELSAEVVDAFAQHGIDLVPCIDPKVLVETTGGNWRIALRRAVGPAGATYRTFALRRVSGGVEVSGTTLLGAPVELFTAEGDYVEALDDGLLASGLLAAFRDAGYPLPPCANPWIGVVAAGASWELTEELSSANAASRGYTGFRLVAEEGAIEVYGSLITVVRPDGAGQLTLQAVAVLPTQLAPSSFDDTTTCPNQRSYGANVAAGLSWKQMMTAVAPPKPPNCIPSLFEWCRNP